jgi:hypothetical protein
VIRPPELVSPEQDALLSDTKPLFDWSDVDQALSYTIVVSIYPDLSSPLINAAVPESQYISTVTLPKRTLYWRVRANGAKGSSQWTTTQSFRIQ